MKIEKLNDNQVKFILNKSDLLERDIKIGELAYGSEKTQELFREMMLQAMIECDFHPNNTPLMIEAIPMSSDSIVIIVTKVSAPEDIEDKFNYFTNQKDVSSTNTKPKRKPSKNNPQKKKSNDILSNILIYSFDSIDNMAKSTSRILENFGGDSSSYIFDNKFYLVLERDPEKEIPENYFESILSEYGQKHVSNSISKYYLIEHGDSFIPELAVEKLSKYIRK